MFDYIGRRLKIFSPWTACYNITYAYLKLLKQSGGAMFGDSSIGQGSPGRANYTSDSADDGFPSAEPIPTCE